MLVLLLKLVSLLSFMIFVGGSINEIFTFKVYAIGDAVNAVDVDDTCVTDNDCDIGGNDDVDDNDGDADLLWL